MKKISEIRNKSFPKVRPLERCLLLFSGGLDSILAARILEKQDIKVTALTFVSHFFDAGEAKKSARENSIKLRIEDFSNAHLEIVRAPRFGRGAGMNPCVDCHLLMLELAKKIAAREKFDVIATGEVLGQRPMSQNAQALKLIERETGLIGKILRPLSAKALPETEYEKKGIVIREKLQGISGRGRKVQIELVKKFGVKYYPSPAGGCVLTEKEYSKKLEELLEKVKKPKPSDFVILRIGRHFWDGNTHIILGRNHEENLKLKKLAEAGDTMIEPENIPGPTALVRGRGIEASIEASMEVAKEKITKYSKNPANVKIKFSKKKI